MGLETAEKKGLRARCRHSSAYEKPPSKRSGITHLQRSGIITYLLIETAAPCLIQGISGGIDCMGEGFRTREGLSLSWY